MESLEQIQLYYLWLQRACGIASPTARALLSHFDGSVIAVYEAAESDYAPVEGMNAELCRKLCDKSLREAQEVRAYCQNEGVGLLVPDSPLYPTRLRQIPNPPMVLYYRGNLRMLEDEVCIAAIGTRRMTEYGSHTAYSLAYDLSRAGAVIVSGMAKGIDGMAHRGALDAGGYTVAVLGCGIDRVYPPEHKDLMEEIAFRGLVVTEYPPFTPPIGHHFPVRNRIISGLCQGAVVIEAPERSGALITADRALKQGRDVFAIPGKLGEMTSTGTNELIKNGARIVTGASDILLTYQASYPDKIDLGRIEALRSRHFESPVERAAAPLPYTLRQRNEDEAIRRALMASEKQIAAEKTAKKAAETKRKASAKPSSASAEERTAPQVPPTFTIPEHLPSEQRALLVLLMREPMSADRLSVLTGRGVGDVLSDLTILEIEGCVEARPGGIYTIHS